MPLEVVGKNPDLERLTLTPRKKQSVTSVLDKASRILETSGKTEEQVTTSVLFGDLEPGPARSR